MSPLDALTILVAAFVAAVIFGRRGPGPGANP